MDRVLDLSYEVTSQMLEHKISNGISWRRSSVKPQESIIYLNDGAVRELVHVSNLMSCSSKVQEQCSIDQFECPELIRVMHKVKKRIDVGPGFAVVHALPIAEIGREAATAIFWLLGKILGRPVAQKWDQTMMYKVRDTGQLYSYGVRGSYTNVELCFHNDNAFNIAVPRTVGLLCINPAKSGGTSRFCSFYSVHNELLQKHPKILSRLYEPVYWDRQKEHDDKEPIVAYAPIFRWKNGQLYVRANVSLNRKGYKILGLEIDARTEDALSTFEETLSNPELWTELPLKAGELQYLNNQEIAHYRSKFEDFEDPMEKRLLIRSWHRDHGAEQYDG